MEGYLRRLVTRNARGVQPVVRSASPLAQEDQRVGMPGFESLAALVEESEPLVNPPTADKAEAGRLNPLLPKEGRLRPQTNAAQPPLKADGVVAREPGFGVPTFNIPQERPPRPRQFGKEHFIDGAATPPYERGDFDEPEQPSPIVITEPYGTAIHREEVIDKPLLEPFPRPTTPAQMKESSRDEREIPDNTAAPEPRLIIGRINVEVIPPPAEPKRSAPVRSGPLTAASVSVIGPLFSSRYR